MAYAIKFFTHKFTALDYYKLFHCLDLHKRPIERIVDHLLPAKYGSDDGSDPCGRC